MLSQDMESETLLKTMVGNKIEEIEAISKHCDRCSPCWQGCSKRRRSTFSII
ncbi:hypothetical protein M3650_16975 [Paenibacillus sp. MER TA 81-3]|uniref:hypothetical protein n=1 Tax=Paenibacillus sp. MER TA 81-3 TaxID=2939573 RepID=UPI00203ABC53|nr:hypothetical protein [Paenibacillus sp. MER TA 81-3]MCM3340292.1 hypothetical protein [Paenibacillus sp. MER TA 81-3]